MCEHTVKTAKSSGHIGEKEAENILNVLKEKL
jgi:uncharacterized membrane protein YebE (DUF533 family)